MYSIFLIFTLFVKQLVGEDIDWRIIGGREAIPGTHPYQVSIRIRGASHYCGGSVISSTCILTAAHCVRNLMPQSIEVIVGSHTLQPQGVIYQAKCVISHPDFNPGTLVNDIGIITLTTPIVFQTNLIDSIELHNAEVAESTQSVLSGWGTTSYPTINNPNNLQELNFTIVGKETCGRYHNIIFDSQICAQAQSGSGACYGDSGGPLVIQTNPNGGKDKQIGVVSWGRPCAVGVPDVFTKVSYYYNWIMLNCQSCFDFYG